MKADSYTAGSKLEITMQDTSNGKSIDEIMKLSADEKMNMMLDMMMHFKNGSAKKEKALEKRVKREVEIAVMDNTKQLLANTEKEIGNLQAQVS